MTKALIPPPWRPKRKLANLPLDQTLGDAIYEKTLEGLQVRLREIQLAYRRDGRRALVVFEGWDAAGKGGAIRRMSTVMDPRSLKVWPIAAPSPEERKHHYLYRFWRRLPEQGAIAVFDRSWYGRVLVERVEKLASPAEWRRAYGEIKNFEAMLTDDGARIVKLFLHISAEEQMRRFEERVTDPLKRWKMMMDDVRSFEARRAYQRATDDMLARTTTPRAPWRVIPAENKRYARVACLATIVAVLSTGVSLRPASLSPDLAKAVRRLGLDVPRGAVER